ncbi:unnamed protein product [Effrenium voratum]|uniref:Uncharacterized protein n=1 Tax=Effrenium voratum TaxID=2562239 RepID=A0AA36MKQ4_9DINO|nr:unnamed protein product [Effrenium voratum]CAJ1428821.1 unnamed protein product [Effrenium voratum]
MRFPAPTPLGNADPEWQPPRNEVELEAYNGGSRKCVWAMMLVSILLILHVQRDRYIEALRWHGGVQDHGPALPWELKPIVLANDTFEATFLAPSLRRASSFVKLDQAPLAVNGMAAIFANSTRTRQTTNASAVVVGSSRLQACQDADSDGAAPCALVVQRGADGCQRLAAPDGAYVSSALCVRSQVFAAMATGSSELVVAWDPRGKGGASGRPFSCLARVSFPSMSLLGSLSVDLVSSVIYDHSTGSILTLGFSGSQTIVVDQYSATLKPQLRYSIPISVAWLLHAPKMSDGYLLFLGSEAPFVGSIFAVDLQRQQIYQQDPPTNSQSQRPRRWVLPFSKFVERLPGNPLTSHEGLSPGCSLDAGLAGGA